MENVHVKIDGIEVEVPSNYTILQAAHEAGVTIPTLCYLKDINAIAACRMCLVEATGVRGCRLRSAGCRRHGSQNKHPGSSQIQKNHTGADAVKPPHGMSLLRQK